MANTSENATKPQTKIDTVNATPRIPTKPESVNPDCVEAAIACVILAKLSTKHGQHFSHITKASVLKVIADIRHNRVRIEKANGNEWPVQTIDTAENKIQVSIVLKIGSISLLLNLERDDPKKLSDILISACTEINGRSENYLLKLANRMHYKGTGFPKRDTRVVSL